MFVVTLDQLAQVHQSVHGHGAVVEAVGLVRVQFAHTALPAAERQAGAPYVGEVLADSQLGGRADQFTEGHVTAAVRSTDLALDEPGVFFFLCACCRQTQGQSTDLALDEPGVFFFLCACCRQTQGQKGGASDECLAKLIHGYHCF